MKTLIAVPCMDMVSAPFAQSLATLNKSGECYVSFVVGSLIYDARNRLVQQALQIGADYIMWFDADMKIPPDAMDKMLKHMEEGHDIVTGLYFRRQPHYNAVLFKDLHETEDGKCAHTDFDDYPKDSLFEVGGCGFGCVMTRASIFEDIVLQEGNWFEPKYNGGEDIAFCIRAKNCGYKIMCDSSIKLGHCGHIVVTEEMFNATRV